MIRAHVYDGIAGGGFSVHVAIVSYPPEGSRDVRPMIMRLGGDRFVRWDEISAEGSIEEPTMTLDDGSARALLDALSRHYEGAEDTRALRRDYDAERKRNDKLTDAVIELAKELAAPGGIA